MPMRPRSVSRGQSFRTGAARAAKRLGLRCFAGAAPARGSATWAGIGLGSGPPHPRSCGRPVCGFGALAGARRGAARYRIKRHAANATTGFRDPERAGSHGSRRSKLGERSPLSRKRPVAVKVRKFATVSFRSYRGAFFSFMKWRQRQLPFVMVPRCCFFLAAKCSPELQSPSPPASPDAIAPPLPRSPPPRFRSGRRRRRQPRIPPPSTAAL